MGWDTAGGVAYISGLATFGADFGRASDVPEMHKDSENLISYTILLLILDFDLTVCTHRSFEKNSSCLERTLDLPGP